MASLLEIDTPMFSKIERGDRRAKRTQVIQIANYFNVDEKELLTLWVADKVLDAVEDEEELKSDAIKVAQEKMDPAHSQLGRNHEPIYSYICRQIADIGILYAVIFIYTKYITVPDFPD